MTCDAIRHLRGAIGYLTCSREASHHGSHWDAAENLYWHLGSTSGVERSMG